MLRNSNQIKVRNQYSSRCLKQKGKQKALLTQNFRRKSSKYGRNLITKIRIKTRNFVNLSSCESVSQPEKIFHSMFLYQSVFVIYIFNHWCTRFNSLISFLSLCLRTLYSFHFALFFLNCSTYAFVFMVYRIKNFSNDD